MKIKYSSNPTLILRITLTFFALLQLNAQAQISGGEIKPEKQEKEKGEKKERVKKPYEADSLATTTIYLSGMGLYSFRVFEDQSVYSIYTQELDEVPTYNSGLSFGLVMPLANKLALDAGFTYFGQGEAYSFEDDASDSTFAYRNMYSQIGIPLKLRYTVGDRFQFFGFAGVTPLNILQIRRTSNYSKADGTNVDLGKTTIKDGFTTFNLMATGGIGINYFFNSWGIHLTTEYRRHLLNTYSESTFKRNHFMYAFGLNLGIQIKL